MKKAEFIKAETDILISEPEPKKVIYKLKITPTGAESPALEKYEMARCTDCGQIVSWITKIPIVLCVIFPTKDKAITIADACQTYLASFGLFCTMEVIEEPIQ